MTKANLLSIDTRSQILTSVYVLLALIGLSGSAAAFELQVVGPDGEAVTVYNWLVEEDATYTVNPGVQDGQTLAVGFHRSYMPPVASGDQSNTPASLRLDQQKRYFISVLPLGDYDLSGASFWGDQDVVRVTVNRMPIPTAQITVFVFDDNAPLNGIPDQPEETGLAGFSIILEDAGGRYGQAGGQMMMDAFGNPLGTTYDDAGQVLSMGDSIILTDENGEAVIKNLAPGKYGVQAIPPANKGWVQTSTIEGKKIIDAWVKANEPGFFTEFGPPGYHAFIGFVKEGFNKAALNGMTTVTGQVVNLHMAKPPDTGFFAGAPLDHTRIWIGLNDLSTGNGRAVYSKPAAEDGSFAIVGVPAGSHQLIIWDSALDVIIASHLLAVEPGGGNVDLGTIPVFQWFTRLHHYVFYDENENGVRDEGEVGIPEQAVNIRFRDGTIFQSYPTDIEGFVPFDEVFPFFAWQVAEVDFGRLKATGMTVTVDAGGPIDAADPKSFGGLLAPQLQEDPDNPGQFLPQRSETGPVLTQAFQGFMGQTSVIEWGKKAYGLNENGGISGIVYYATTRAENDPALAGAEPWEPGIPRVQVALYADGDRDAPPYGNFPGVEDTDWNGNNLLDQSDSQIDDLNGDGVTLADVDNYPFDWRPDPENPAKVLVQGGEDVDRDGDGEFDMGDAIAVTTTDSWDDSQPSGCVGDPFLAHGVPTDCYDGMRVFNQVRPGVFDGGYAFDGLRPGYYIVQASPPLSDQGLPMYELAKEEDRNVDFGQEFIPAKAGSFRLLAPACVGEDHLVPNELSLFPGEPAPYAGQQRPLCDLKKVALSNGKNAAADFFFFTRVPISGHIIGMVLDDLANEFDPNSPQFGEKYAPPWLPISIRDWTGREISRTYTDEWGRYNALVPSTFTNNLGQPSGVSPGMLTVCLNDPGPITDPNRQSKVKVTDPFFNRQYSQFCYTLQYMPGTTTYLDTPVLPVGAFTGPDQSPLDCEYVNGTPRIHSVSGVLGGPYAASGDQLTITSQGLVQVPNPLYTGPDSGVSRTIGRDYGFGDLPGQVFLGGLAIAVAAADWSADTIFVTVPATARTGDLVVVRGDNGLETVGGVTVTVAQADDDFSVRRVAAGGSIQAAIDQAETGDLILVEPGVYEELVIMYKPVRLQGWGAGSTFINAIKAPAEKLLNWRERLQQLVVDRPDYLLPAQEVGFGGIEPVTLFNAEGPGVLVLALNASPANGGFGVDNAGVALARIDGLTIYGGDHGGGIVVNGYARDLQISNSRILNNQGFYGGGIRVGHPDLTLVEGEQIVYQDSFNDGLVIRRNQIAQNSTLNGVGGGIGLYTGADGYAVTGNFICGNLSMGNGGGIGHEGLSENGLIQANQIVFNETFNQGTSASGGGIFIGGGAPLNGLNSLSEGSGTVTIDRNLLLGNSAGAGDGGAIAAVMVNGQDVARSRNNLGRWYVLEVVNNMITNNVAALAGGGISLQDVARSQIIHNTIARNDSVATAGDAFAAGSPSLSTSQPAGIVAHLHSAALNSAVGNATPVRPYKVFSNPILANNIIWQNRSFAFAVDNTTSPATFGLIPDVAAGDPAVYWDLGVIGGGSNRLEPSFSVLTDLSDANSTNTDEDPMFLASYFNGPRGLLALREATTGIATPAALDEGGNFIRVSYGPLTLTNPSGGQAFGDYHIRSGSSAEGLGMSLTVLARQIRELVFDFDREQRLFNGFFAILFGKPDAGADEISSL